MAEPPSAPPPPAGPPSSEPPGPWGAPPPQYPPPPQPPAYGAPASWAPPPSGGYGGYGAPTPYGTPSPYGGATRTEPFAIVSLVASLAGFAFCLIGPILGIVFGHIARSRIKRSGDQGSGLALAGIIIGYVEIALIAISVVVLVLVAVNTHSDARPAARALDAQIRLVASDNRSSPRDGDVVRTAIRDTGLDLGSEATFSDVTVGSTGYEAVSATDTQLADAAWRLDVHRSNGHACIVVPATLTASPQITDGSC